MFQYTTTFFRAFLSLIFAFAVFFFGASSASAASYEITGWGWGADNNIIQGYGPTVAGLGWISFSNKSDGTAIPYGVFVNTATGDFSGYAWSSNAGWVTFNAAEMQKCSTNPGDNCVVTGPSPKAHLNTTFNPITGAITGGTGNVTGWARACSVFVSGCSGTVRPDNQTGTWDGWISLSGTGYGLNAMTLSPTTMKFLGPTSAPPCPSCFAWGGGTGSDTGFGWGINLGGLDVSLVPNSVPPLLSFWADQTTLVGSQTTLLHWITGGPGLVGCTAGGTDIGWSGPKLTAPTVRSQSIGPLASSKTYTLQCFGPDGVSSTGIPPPPTDDTIARTLDIAFIPTLVPVDGVCGPATNFPSRSVPTVNLCSSGTPSAVTKDTSVTPNQWKWDCLGSNGGTNVSCSTDVKKAFRIIQF